MNEFDRISAVLNEAGHRDGLEGLRLAPNGTCGVLLIDGVNLQFEWVGQAAKFFVLTTIANLPEDPMQRQAVYEAIAVLNCLSNASGITAVHPPKSQIIYHIGLNTADLDVDRLYDAVDRLLDERPFVLARIEKAITDTAKKQTAAREVIQPRKTAMESIATQDTSWLKELRSLEKGGIRFFYRPCSKADIAEVEAYCNDRLPWQYQQFLTHTGRGSDLLFAGENIFFPDLLSFENQAKNMLRSDGVPLTLPKSAFVFFIHRDTQFFFFQLNEGDNPAIYCYEEGAREFLPVYESFSEFMHAYIALHARSRGALAKYRDAGYLASMRV